MSSLTCGIYKDKIKEQAKQNRNRLTDTEYKLVVARGKAGGDGLNR